MFSQPSVEEGLVADGVQSWHHDVRGRHLVRLHFDLRHLGLPRGPFSTDGHLHRDGVRVTPQPAHLLPNKIAHCYKQNAQNRGK